MSYLALAQRVLDKEPQLHTVRKLQIGPYYTAEFRPEVHQWEVMHGTGHCGLMRLDQALALVAELDSMVTLPQDISILEPKQEPKLTMKSVHSALAALGIGLRRTEFDEYRVNFYGGKEETAYYTDDLRDALQTGQAMAKERAK
jgi:hypothetical protein